MNGEAKILRFNPQTDTEPSFHSFEFEYAPPMTVLDVLNLVRNSLTFPGKNGHSFTPIIFFFVSFPGTSGRAGTPGSPSLLLL